MENFACEKLMRSPWCLEVRNASNDNSARIQQNDFIGAANQFWEIVPNSDKTFYIRPVHTKDKYLEQDAKTLTDDPGVLIQHEKFSGEHQKWILVELRQITSIGRGLG